MQSGIYAACAIRIMQMENAWEVELPDMEAMKKAMAGSKKKKSGGGADVPMPYMGDMTKKHAAKSVKEVIKLVTRALEGMPENEYDAAFEEAGAK